MINKIMKQVELKQGNRRLTTWLDQRQDIKTGARVELKDSNGIWDVIKVYEKEVTEDSLNTYRTFDNNNYDKHTGLFSKRDCL